MSHSRRGFMRSALPGVSWLDVKLAARMLLRQPGLTAVAVFALTIGIPVGLLPLHVLDSMTRPPPVEGGERLVIVRNHDRATSEAVRRPVHDFMLWREELSSFESLGMARSDLFNVGSEDGGAAPVQGAEVTASVFSMLRVPPLLGRPLDAADERIGAPDVVVIGYDVWQTRLAGDPNVIGRTLRIGAVPHTVVGVMPEEFQFPVRDQLWLPFRVDPVVDEPGAGPVGSVMGRLGEGVSLEEAQRELEFLGERLAAERPDVYGRLQPQVLPYTRALTGVDSPDARLTVVFGQVLAFILLALACANVGILVLARVATRTGEIAIRTALGASRARILSQLFIESLLLAAVSAGIGLLVLQAIATGPDYLLSGLPFWVDFEVSARTAVLALSLAVLSAAIAGVVPALKATGRGVHASMQRATGGGSGIRFGKGYSALIIGEVAVAVWFLALGASLLPSATASPGGIGIEPERYLFGTVRISGADVTATSADGTGGAERVAFAHQELVRRLAAEPGLGSVAIGSAMPGMSHTSRYVQVEGVERSARAPAPAFQVNTARVDPGYFEALGKEPLIGRGFNAADLGEDRTAVVVNAAFVENVLGGRSPVGRRVRYWTPDDEPGPWAYEIVGVVDDLGTGAVSADAAQALYHVAAPGELHPFSFAVRTSGDPEAFIPRLRSIVTEIDAGALLQDPARLDRVPNPDRRALSMMAYLVAVLATIAVVLGSACLYALMSFTVAERRRECAIRAALGAQTTNIIGAIARRAMVQLCAGAALGAVLAALVLSGSQFESSALRTADWRLVIGLVVMVVITVGMAACVKPTLRAVRIRPAEVLKG